MLLSVCVFVTPMVNLSVQVSRVHVYYYFHCSVFIVVKLVGYDFGTSYSLYDPCQISLFSFKRRQSQLVAI